MIRYLFILLAVVGTGLAFLFDALWLYVLAGGVDVGLLGYLGWEWWAARERVERPSSARSEPEDREDSLQDLGIVDIRPQEEGAEGGTTPQGDEVDVTPGPPEDESDTASPGTESARADSESTDETVPPRHPSTSDSPSSGARPVQREADERADASATTSTRSDDAPVLAPLLESLRAALDAKTVGLLVQEDLALTYRIEALASVQSDVRTTGTFDTQTPLLTATMAHEAVTVRTLAQDDLTVEDLGYYEQSPTVDHLAVAPVSRSDDPATYILFADASAAADLPSSRGQTVLEHYAETLALLLNGGPAPAAKPGPEATEANTEEGSEPSPGTAEGFSEDPRPRREIIKEEMEAAVQASEDLSLVLVHLNRAESIARQGNEAVASAERLLRARLERAAPGQRLERFGELTYGLFVREGVETVEPWAADLEDRMDEETGTLEGGVSVGVAVRGARHDTADDLRAEATEALREAYETGTPTVVS